MTSKRFGMIALAGKGGTGKSSIAGLLIQALRRRGREPILAVDADPNATLAEILDIQPGQSVVGVIDAIAKNPDVVPAGVPKERFMELEVQESVGESEGVDLLVMGRPEGPGCYCYANSILRGMLQSMAEGYPTVVLDNEAGMEHLSRRIAGTIEVLLLISDYSMVGVRSAIRVNELAGELNLPIRRRGLVLNKVNGPTELLEQAAAERGLSLYASVPMDEMLAQRSLRGQSLMDLPQDSPAVQAVEVLCERILNAEDVPNSALDVKKE